MIDSITNIIGVTQAQQQNKISHDHEISALKLANDLMQQEGQSEVELLEAVDQVSAIEEGGHKINVKV
jgi:hypothetical protein